MKAFFIILLSHIIRLSVAFMTPMVDIQKRSPRLNQPQSAISHVAPSTSRTKDFSTRLTAVDSIGIEQVVLIGAIGASIASAYMNPAEEMTDDVKDDPEEEKESDQEPVQEQQQGEEEEMTVEEEPAYSIKAPDVNAAKKAVASTKSIVKERLQRLRNSSDDVVEVKVKKSNVIEEIKVEKTTKQEDKRTPSLVSRVVRKVFLPWTKF